MDGLLALCRHAVFSGPPTWQFVAEIGNFGTDFQETEFLPLCRFAVRLWETETWLPEHPEPRLWPQISQNSFISIIVVLTVTATWKLSLWGDRL